MKFGGFTAGHWTIWRICAGSAVAVYFLRRLMQDPDGLGVLGLLSSVAFLFSSQAWFFGLLLAALLLVMSRWQLLLALAALPALLPRWIAPAPREGDEQIFYDGHCALCHGFVNFVLEEDTRGEFRFAPIQSDRFAEALQAAGQQNAPDSIAVLVGKDRLLFRSAAVSHVLSRLGGPWRLLAMLMQMFPGGLRDVIYDFVARHRRRIFGEPPALCPVLPPPLRTRFDL
jgi:predicted DCC family thiol-disulfide oxidoreductase YuxK